MSEEIIDIHCGWGPTPAAPYWNQADAVRTALRSRGITMACLSSTLARRYDMVAGNDSVAEAAREQNQECDLHGWLVVHPAQLAEASTQMRRYLTGDRFLGIALYADPLTGHPVTLDAAREVLTVFRRYGKALLIETNSEVAMAHAVEIATFLGNIKVIVSGMGGEDWTTSIDMAARPTNVFLDISGVLVTEKIAYAIKVMNGARKLLFASGAPGTDPAAVLALLDGLSPDEREKILSGNALRILGRSGFGMGEGERSGSAGLTPVGG